MKNSLSDIQDDDRRFALLSEMNWRDAYERQLFIKQLRLELRVAVELALSLPLPGEEPPGDDTAISRIALN